VGAGGRARVRADRGSFDLMNGEGDWFCGEWGPGQRRGREERGSSSLRSSAPSPAALISFSAFDGRRCRPAAARDDYISVELAAGTPPFGQRLDRNDQVDRRPLLRPRASSPAGAS
jgi:hypothetical protein